MSAVEHTRFGARRGAGLARPKALRLAPRPDRAATAVHLLGTWWKRPAWASSGSTGLFSIFGGFPCSTCWSGIDASNPPDSVIKWLEQDRYYRWCTYLFLPLQYAGLIFACWMWSHGGLSALRIDRAGAYGRDGGGVAINTAHELGHKRASSERWL